MKPTTPMKVAILAAALAAALPVGAGLCGTSGRPDPHLLAPPGASNSRAAGMVVWFNSVLRPAGMPLDRPVTICVSQQVISVRHGGETDTIEVPDAVIAFKPWESRSATHFGGEKWKTSVPSSQAARDTFMSGAAEPFIAGLPSDTTSITWTGRFESDTPGVSVQWRWSAAGYTQFDDEYGALTIETGNRLHADPAGTPVDFKAFAKSDAVDGTQFVGWRSVAVRVVAEVTGRCAGVY